MNKEQLFQCIRPYCKFETNYQDGNIDLEGLGYCGIRHGDEDAIDGNLPVTDYPCKFEKCPLMLDLIKEIAKESKL